MPDPEPDIDPVARRATRLAELVAELTHANRRLASTMREAEFHAMVQHMAEQQLLYEEFGDQ